MDANCHLRGASNPPERAIVFAALGGGHRADQTPRGRHRRAEKAAKWKGCNTVNALTAYRRMARNNAWANATLHAAVQTMSTGAFTDPRPGFFGSLCETLNHILMVDLYYIDALEDGGLGLVVFDRDELMDPTLLVAAQAETDARLIRFCDALTPQGLGAMHVIARPNGPMKEETAALLLHLFQHQVHHRGQAHVQLSDAGIAPPQLDDFHLVFGRVPSAEAYWT